MAVPPTIPTSFVPHPASDDGKRYSTDVMGAFAFLGYGILALALLLSIAVFFYGRVLKAEQTAKDQSLAQEEAAIDPHTIDAFVRLENRLSYGEQLLNSHVALSGFFAAIETLLPTTVRFTSLHISFDDSGTPLLQGAGEAKSFNALAAVSDAFAKDGRLKDAILSKITVGQGSVVSFNLTASLDPALIAYAPSASVAPVEAATTTPAALPPQATTTPSATSSPTTP